MTTPVPHPASRWAATTTDNRRYSAPKGRIDTDIAIVGGGFSGLTAAYHLHHMGRQSVVLEANRVGWGGSGRNGGMVVARYKKSFAALAGKYGDQVTLELYRLILDGIDTIEQTVRRHNIPCGFSRAGHITAAYAPGSLESLRQDLEWLRRVAGDETPSLLSRNQAQALIGSPDYVGGYLDPRGGGIHPLNYAKGLASTLADLGVPIYEEAAVNSIGREGAGYRLRLANGASVQAGCVAIATGAYSDLLPFSRWSARSLVPVTTSIISTKPVSGNTAGTILPHGHLVSDTKHLMNYFRMLPGNRLLFGGRGSITRNEDRTVLESLQRAMLITYPQLGDIEIENTWSGQVDVTLDDFPHVGQVEGLFYALGFGGRGVVLTTVLGKILAKLLAGERVRGVPMTDNRFGPIPFHGWRLPAMRFIATYYGWKDQQQRRRRVI